jgi:hypothetical protein
MKKKVLVVITVFILSVGLVSAQNKITKYCMVNVGPENKWTTRLIARLSLGEKEFYALKDPSELKSLSDVNHLTTAVDVLNYMSSLGWTPINIYSGIGPFYLGATIYFSKIYDKSEFEQ